MDWRDLWCPAGIFGMAGAAGLVAVRWDQVHRATNAGSLLALLLVAACGVPNSGDVFVRGAVAVSLTWGFLLTIATWGHDHRSQQQSLPLLFVLFGGLNLLAQAGDWVTMFLGLQLIAWGSNVISGISREPHRPEHGVIENEFAAATIGAPQVVFAALLLLGLVLLTAVTGSTRISVIHEALQTSYVNRESAKYAIAGGGSRMLTLSAVLVGSALAGYAACVPFHWRAARIVATTDAVLAPAVLLLPRAAVLLVWLKLWPACLTTSAPTAQLLAGVLTVITFAVPLLEARAAQNLARQWTLLAVAQGGWLLLALAAWSFESKTSRTNEALPIVEWNLPNAAQAVWLWLLLDGAALIGLFSVLHSLQRQLGRVGFVDDLRGLVRSEPAAALCASAALLSLTGWPLLAGFWSRLFVGIAALNVRGEWGPPQTLVPHDGLLLLTAFAAVTSVWTVSIAGRSVWSMLFGIPLGQSRTASSTSSLFAAAVAAMLLIGCGLLPGPLLSWLSEPNSATHPTDSPVAPDADQFGPNVE